MLLFVDHYCYPHTTNPAPADDQSPRSGSRSPSKRKPSRRELDLESKLKTADEKLKEKEKQNKDLKKKIVSLQKDLGTLKAERDILATEKAAAEEASSVAHRERQMDRLAFEVQNKHKEELLKKLLSTLSEVIVDIRFCFVGLYVYSWGEDSCAGRGLHAGGHGRGGNGEDGRTKGLLSEVGFLDHT